MKVVKIHNHTAHTGFTRQFRLFVAWVGLVVVHLFDKSLDQPNDCRGRCMRLLSLSYLFVVVVDIQTNGGNETEPFFDC